MASRGMGAMAASKMPKAKTIVRKDNPDDVTMYKKGGKVKKIKTTMPKKITRTRK